MEQTAFDNIISRHHALRGLLAKLSRSHSEVKPNIPMKVRFSIETVESTFMSTFCCCVDGDSAHFRSIDGKQEARQMVCLLAFDAKHELIGVYGWALVTRGTPRRAIREGYIDRKSAALFVILTHREWFKSGELPIGLPYPDSLPEGLLLTEIVVSAFGDCGIPSPWSATIRD